MGHVGMVNELELLDDSNSSIHIVDVYDSDSGEWCRAPSRSKDWYVTSEQLTKKINKMMMKLKEDPEIFEAEVVIHEC